MAIIDAFPGVSGAVDSVELRKNLAGLIVRDSAGLPRGGIFPRHGNPLITARADMAVDVAGFEGATVRGGGPLFQANDGTTVVAITAAPVANSRIDVVYFKQNESTAPFADANNAPIIAVLAGTAAAVPVKPSLAGIAGAEEIGTVLVPTGKTATNQTGVIVTATHRFTTTSGGILPVRSSLEYPAAPSLNQYVDDATLGDLLRWNGSAWVSVARALTVGVLGSDGNATVSNVDLTRSRSGLVYLSFRATRTNATTYATSLIAGVLPVGFRPLGNLNFGGCLTYGSGTINQIQVLASGIIQLTTPAPAGHTILDASITFMAV